MENVLYCIKCLFMEVKIGSLMFADCLLESGEIFKSLLQIWVEFLRNELQGAILSLFTSCFIFLSDFL